MVTEPQSGSYPARLEIDYPEKLDRFSTFFRLIWIIPIAIVASLPSSTAGSTKTTVMVSATDNIAVKRETVPKQGIIVPITWRISPFSDTLNIYEVQGGAGMMGADTPVIAYATAAILLLGHGIVRWRSPQRFSREGT